MEAIVIAGLALALGLVIGFLAGVRMAGRLIVKTLKHEMDAGRMTREQVIRLSDLPGART